MRKEQLPRAPKHLRAATKKWFNAVLRDFELESHHVRLLQLAGEAWDRIEEARETITTQGAYYMGRFGPRPHPALAVERDNKTLFARLLRELALDVAPPESRPPGIGR